MFGTFFKRKLLNVFFLVLFLNQTFNLLRSQSGSIIGYVRDSETNQTLPGVTIQFDNTGFVTDVHGQFVFTQIPGEHTLRFSFIGYQYKVIKVKIKSGLTDTMTVFLSPSSKALNMVVVSSSLYEKNITRETVSMEVISARQIENTNSNDVGEVVGRTSGILVQENQISIRGGSSYSYGVGARTAVIVDGLSFTSADLGDIQSKFAPIENIKQVEVIKGASSVAYGSSAMNGVVNIITDWPSDEKGQTKLTLNTGFFSNPPSNYMRWWEGQTPFFSNININHGRRQGRFSYTAGGNITLFQSYLEKANEFRMRSYFKTRLVSGKNPGISYGLNGSVMHEASDRFFISKDMDSSILFIAEGSNDKYWRFVLDPHINIASPKGDFFRIYGRWLHIFRRGNGSDPNALSHMFSVDLRYQRRVFNERLIFSVGMPFSYSVNTSNLYPGTRLTYSGAGYLQVEGQPWHFMNIIAGLRYEFNKIDKYFAATDPILRTGINIAAGKTSFLRLSWGQAYRLPTIGERFLQQEFTQSVFIIPNPDLKIERAWSAEFGFMQAIKLYQWKALLDMAIFWQEFENFVEYRFGLYPNMDEFGKPIFPNQAASVNGLKPFNVENARIPGYEISLKTDGKLGALGITTQIGYMYHWPANLDSVSVNKSPSATIKDSYRYMTKRVEENNSDKILFYRSRHLLRGDVELQFKKLFWGGAFYYTSLPEKIPVLLILTFNFIDGGRNTFERYLQKHIRGDFTFDLRAGFEISEKIRLGFIIKNVTNRVYALRPGRPEPLRNYTLQLRFLL